MLVDTPDAPSTESILNEKQAPHSYYHSLNTVKAVLKLEKRLLLNSISIADDLHKTLKQQVLACRPLL